MRKAVRLSLRNENDIPTNPRVRPAKMDLSPENDKRVQICCRQNMTAGNLAMRILRADTLWIFKYERALGFEPILIAILDLARLSRVISWTVGWRGSARVVTFWARIQDSLADIVSFGTSRHFWCTASCFINLSGRAG